MYVKFLAIDHGTRNKAITVVLISSGLLAIFYWYSYRPMMIKKECATVTYVDYWEARNPEYNEAVEKQKREKLGDYIQCRNSNIAEGDKMVILLKDDYTFTETQYRTLPLDNLILTTLNHPYFKPDMLYAAYFHNLNGGSITYGQLDELRKNKDKYPHCDFPQGFVRKDIYESTNHSRDASDGEYKSCLRKNGIDK